MLPRSVVTLPIVSWALYDFANTIFSYAVVTRYFNEWLLIQRDAPEYTVGLMTLGVSLVLVVTLSFFGAVADRAGRRKPPRLRPWRRPRLRGRSRRARPPPPARPRRPNQRAFLPTALLFLLFALPCFLFVREGAGRPVRRGEWLALARAAAGQLAATARQAGELASSLPPRPTTAS